jgi:hypothetical protein
LVVHPYLGVRPTSLVQRRSTSVLVLLHPCTLARPTTMLLLLPAALSRRYRSFVP